MVCVSIVSCMYIKYRSKNKTHILWRYTNFLHLFKGIYYLIGEKGACNCKRYTFKYLSGIHLYIHT